MRRLLKNLSTSLKEVSAIQSSVLVLPQPGLYRPASHQLWRGFARACSRLMSAFCGVIVGAVEFFWYEEAQRADVLLYLRKLPV